MDSEGDTISRIPSFPEPPKSAGAILVLGTYKTISDNADTPGSIDESYSDRDSFFADSAPFNMAGIDPKTAQSESTDFGGRASMEPEVAYNIRRQSSPVLPVEDLRQVSVVSTELQFAEDGALASLPSSARSGKSTGSQHDGEKEMVPLVLDTQAEASSTGPSSQRDSLAQPAGWHRRVGDACPTFSNRKNGEKSPRRVVAPTPLLLSRSSRTRIAESPAPPLESPQHALDIIQQQLKDLDEADSEAAVEDKQRRKLLENLEAEMGAQETHWQDIRRNLTNRSPSSIRSSLSLVPSGDLHLSPRPSSPALRSPDLGLPVMRGGADPTSAPKNHTKTPADEKSDPAPSRLTRRSNSGFTDEVSAQATVGGVENRAKFGKSASRNKDGLESTSITNDIFAHRQLANHSTTPEKTEAKGKDEDEDFNSASAKKNNLNTWTEPGSVKFVPVEKAPLPVSHWSIDSDTTSLASETLQRAQNIAQAPDNLIRTAASTSPLSRDAGETQALQSINKGFVSPTSPASATWLSRESLISPPVSEQTQSPRRPVTQKPPRRSKRITLLPDIPESPKPLSNKRGTLGFFQFPWGETSDNATLPAQLASVPLPGATLNELTQAQPFVPSQGPVLPSQVYPASFFDHYSDDELPAADSDEGYSDDEDEAFDETTLWEIANLLRSSAVPSRGSLFPGSEDYRPPSRAGFVSNDETTVLAVRELPTVDISKDKALPPLPPADTAVWKSNTMYATTTTRSAGLAQPDAKTWTRYLGKPAETLRPAPRKSVPASISSSSLWAPAVAKAEPVAKSTSSSLWRSPKEVPTTPASTNPSTPFLASPSTTESSISQMSAPIKATSQSYLLWTPPPSVARVPLGLPQDDGEWDRYTAKKVQSSRPKPRPSTQDAIQSTGLWTSSKFVAAASALAPTTTRAVSPSQSLWSKSAIPTEHAEGLWSASHIRHRYKTTDKRPAALDTERKLRIDRRPLAALRSASLWSTTTQTPTRQVPDWLALSTTLRPVSPDGASTLSDQDYGSAFDTYSLRSEVTAASSVAAAKQPAHRKTASKQAAQDELDAAFRDVMQTKPVVPEPVAEEEAAQPPQESDEKVELFFDSSRFHPVFAVDVLHVTSENVHPAAAGYLHSVINGAPKPRRR
ncbi:hypothetical protein IF1G_03175 [Cordyceps javanica]|uniref:Uncharacterized protein n=1 Tax=Cordyceps javanica TaxID=43265 RepID=A0A545W5W0_9HYPO|nr:hypothetical protein IF1G_03175 [Cordyceps javanica]TQW09383.1 hypothetical protein IF2G_03814 [Cordyceps javanica]